MLVDHKWPLHFSPTWQAIVLKFDLLVQRQLTQ
jgi:hypothetical protein